MQKSDTIGELAKALSIVQGKIEGAKKDSVNPFFRSKYADLASVWEACREHLASNGLAVVQTMSLNADYSIVVDTTLIHSSGEWISGQLGLKAVKDDPQGAGSAITYARRYALAAIVGIAPEDDDAEGATTRKTAVQSSAKPSPKPTESTGEASKDKIDTLAHEIINLDWLNENLSKAKWTEKTALSWLKSKANYTGLDFSGELKDVIGRMNKAQAQFLVHEIESRVEMA